MDQLFAAEVSRHQTEAEGAEPVAADTPAALESPAAPKLPWVSARVGVDPTSIILTDDNGEVVGRLQITNAKDFSNRRLTSVLRDVLHNAGAGQ